MSTIAVAHPPGRRNGSIPIGRGDPAGTPNRYCHRSCGCGSGPLPGKTRSTADAAKHILPAEEDVEHNREERAHGALPKVKRDVLVIHVVPVEWEQRLLVHTNGADRAEGPHEGIGERECAIVPDDLCAARLNSATS